MGQSMKILIVSPGSSWVLDSIAKKTSDSCPEHFTAWSPPAMKGISYSPPEGPWNGILFWDIQNMWHPEWRHFYPNSLHIGAYTHAHEDNPQNINPRVKQLDGVIHMAARYRDMFERCGLFPPERMIVLRPGEVAGSFPLKKTKIGICQRGEHVGKGRDFLPEVIRSLRPEMRDCIELHFKGKGWDDAFEGKTFRGAVFVGAEKPETWFSGSYYGVSAFSYTSEDAKSYPAFYNILDYLMMVGLYEGGPMSALEGFATGLPIISSAVGWMTEFGVEHLYDPGDVAGLSEILTSIAERRIVRRGKVEGMSYKNYASGVLKFFEHLRELN